MDYRDMINLLAFFVNPFGTQRGKGRNFRGKMKFFKKTYSLKDENGVNYSH